MAEDGVKQIKKGLETLIAFQHECRKAHGEGAQDGGLETVSKGETEERFGPQTNDRESWTGLGRYKTRQKNRVVVVDCDRMMFHV